MSELLPPFKTRIDIEDIPSPELHHVRTYGAW